MAPHHLPEHDPDTPTGPILAGTALSQWVVPGASAAVAVGLNVPATGPPTISVENVLEHVIEGYLLGDLESCATEIQPKEIGAAGYLMVMAVLAGSELLGALTSDERQENRIKTYWETFLTKIDPKYGFLGEIATSLARNGIAHSYLSHLGVLVVRGDPPKHLSLWGGEVVFDCLELYAHFRQSYESYARTHIVNHRAEAQRRVDALVQHDHVKANRLIARLPAEHFPETRGPIVGPFTTASAGADSLATPRRVRGPRESG